MAQSPLPRHHPTQPATKNRSAASHRPPRKSKNQKTRLFDPSKKKQQNPTKIFLSPVFCAPVPSPFAAVISLSSKSHISIYLFPSSAFPPFRKDNEPQRNEPVRPFERFERWRIRVSGIPLAPSQPPIENGDSCRLFFEPTAPSHMEFSQTPYYHAQLPNYGNAVTGAHPTQTMAPGGVNGSIPGQSGVHGRLAMQPGFNLGAGIHQGWAAVIPPASSRSPPSHQAARPIANTGVKAAKSPGGSKAAGVVSTSPIRELHFKYRVFAHSVIYEIEKANSAKVASNDLSKATKKIISTNDVKWTASLEDYTWEEFVPAAFNMHTKYGGCRNSS
ncbi:hypothetical protein Pst134EB_029741 [Puccinia striiformis f. sp. tritici]|nr:hypothetical protein Pst134EB_029741 [Puccinia striiformis f. sp. tritici]